MRENVPNSSDTIHYVRALYPTMTQIDVWNPKSTRDMFLAYQNLMNPCLNEFLKCLGNYVSDRNDVGRIVADF